MKVVITGMGAVCAVGVGVPALWDAAAKGVCRARWAEPARGKPVPIYLASDLGAAARRTDRCTHLALAAAAEAMAHAGLTARPVEPRRLAVVMGTSRGPTGTWEETMSRFAGGERQGPTLLADGSLASLSGAISVAAGARGMSLTVSATCASAAHALALGAERIVCGEADAVIVGGSDSALHPALLEQYASAGILGSHADRSRACRPFDRTRDGTVMGEGAGVLVLESAESARRRGARVLAELAGWGTAADAMHRTAPDEAMDGLKRAMEAALARAAVKPRDVGYVNAHGSGTRQSDAAEGRAIAALFGDGQVCSSTKPVTGHCAGATPALEAIVCVMAMREGFIPPTATCREVDGDCGVDPVPGDGRAGALAVVLSTSLGFWGNNAAVVLRRFSR